MLLFDLVNKKELSGYMNYSVTHLEMSNRFQLTILNSHYLLDILTCIVG